MDGYKTRSTSHNNQRLKKYFTCSVGGQKQAVVLADSFLINRNDFSLILEVSLYSAIEANL